MVVLLRPSYSNLMKLPSGKRVNMLFLKASFVKTIPAGDDFSRTEFVNTNKVLLLEVEVAWGNQV